MQEEYLAFSLVFNKISPPGPRSLLSLGTGKLLDKGLDHVFSLGWHHEGINGPQVNPGRIAMGAVEQLFITVRFLICTLSKVGISL